MGLKFSWKDGLTWERNPMRSNAYSLQQWINDSYMGYAGNSYSIIPQQTLLGNNESIPGNFSGVATQAYKQNGVVFACMLVRLLLFSEARMVFRELRNGMPGDLRSGDGLEILRTPWPGGTTGDLLARAIQDVDIAGNFFCLRRADRLIRLRPDWVTIVLGSPDENASPWDPSTQVIGYTYKPGGPSSQEPMQAFLAEDVAHFAPIPDPLSPYRGVSWLYSVLPEVEADGAATAHKRQFFQNGATVNLVVTTDPTVGAAAFKTFKELFQKENEGLENAYRTLFIGGGVTATPVGSDFRQMDFKVTQGAGETRIAAAAGVPPVIVGLSEGLQAATYSNYGQARRRFADGTIRPLWRNFCGSMARIIDVPNGMELWFDDSDVPFLREDEKDRADIQSVQALSIKALVDAGFEAETVISAITANDFSALSHTGLFSVQLQPPMPDGPAEAQLEAGRALAKLLLPHLQPPADPGPKREHARELEQMRFEQGRLSERVIELAARSPQLQLSLDPHIEIHPGEPPQVTIEPAEVNVTTPELRLEPHIEVHAPDPAEINIAPAEVNVTTPDIHVTTPELRLEPHIEVAQPEVNITTPDIHVTTPDVRLEPHIEVHQPESPEINITTPDIQFTAPDVRLEPHIDVQPADVRVEPQIDVHVPAARRTRKKIERDNLGEITEITEEEIGGDDLSRTTRS